LPHKIDGYSVRRVSKGNVTKEGWRQVTASWEPADGTERALVAALDADDLPAFARIVMSARLYLPAERTVDELVAYTSVASLHFVLGAEREYAETDFGALAPDRTLMLNPGLPIAASMPPADLRALAEGQSRTLPIRELRAAISYEVNSAIRQGCLDELGDGSAPVEAEPASDLERKLVEAVASKDQDEFLDALIFGEVVVPVTGPAPEPGQGVFPWRPVSVGALRVIPMFSSAGLLDRTVAPNTSRATVSFLDALADWPEEDHMLCLDPGSSTELVLPGDVVAGLIDSIADTLASVVPDLLAD
jgi:hypothetical protein